MKPADRVEAIARHVTAGRTAAGESAGQPPMRVLVTGAAGQIAYSLLVQIASGRMLGPQQRVVLHLLDIPPAEKALRGVALEIEDLASPVIAGMVVTTSQEEAFTDIDLALLIGARPRGKGMERKDLLQANAKIFSAQGKLLNTLAKKTVRVVVVGNPANTNCLIAMRNAPSIPQENFSALTRLDQNRAEGQIAKKLGVGVGCVGNVVIWGNHSATMVPDVRYGTVVADGLSRPIVAAVNDDEWLHGEFVKTIQQRGAAIIAARGLSSAASAANAVIEHVRDWIHGTAPGRIVSMAVVSDGSYGIQKGLIFSFPVTCASGRYEIVRGLAVDGRTRQLLKVTENELIGEKQGAGV